MKKYCLFIAVIIATLCFAFATHAESEKLDVTTVFDKEEYDIGTEVTATYKISGGSGIYTRGEYICYIIDNAKRKNVLVGELNTETKTGTITFTPDSGDYIYILYTVFDSNGSSTTIGSKSIKLNGTPSFDPIWVDSDFSNNRYMDDELTVTYQIKGGSGTYTKGTYICYSLDRNEVRKKVASGNLDIINKNGKINFTVPSGNDVNGAYLEFFITDSEGRSESIDSYRVALENVPVIIHTTFDKNTYAVGNEITATWNITKTSATCTRIDYICYTNDDETYSSNLVQCGKLDLTKTKGTIKFTPETGSQAYVLYMIYDTSHTTDYQNSDMVELTGGIQAGEGPFSLGITFNCDEYNLGSEMSIFYEIYGTEGLYTSCEYEWYVIDQNYSYIKASSGTLDFSQKKGYLKFTPRTGIKAFVRCVLHGPDGRTTIKDSAVIDLIGTPEPTESVNPTSSVHPTISPTPAPINDPTPTPKPNIKPTPEPEPADKVEAFVARCYSIILGRQPDAGGLKTWYNELVSGRRAASEIIDCFVRSQEFLGKNYNNGDAVEILYKAMLGRGSDPAGKATWVGKLDAGHPFAVVINGFCGSKEFKEICDAYGITPGSVSTEQGSESDQQIRAFVTRCYKIILGRDADEGGMNTWFNELKSRRRAAAEIIEQFVYSQEFQNKKYSNADAVEILYKAMLGRGSDPAGKADWVAKLNNGQPLTAIINGFCGSMEFGAICDAYGITPGSVQVQQLSSQPVVEEEPVAKQTVTKTENNVTKVEIVNPSDTENAQLGTAVQAIYINEEKAKEFIGRCYRCILGREAGQPELDSWIGQMLNGTKTADQIARGFLFSGEFKDKNVCNEELVKILYRVYMNREADAEGLATWTQKLDEGTSLQAVLDTFAKTNEFRSVVAEMSK